MDEVVSDVSICNSALVKLGVDLISNLANDTKTARLCNNRFPYIRNIVLEAHPWACATKTVSMAPVSGTVTLDGWANAFEKPGDFLKMVRGEDWDVEYDTVDGYLVSDENPFIIKYIWKNTNAASYSYSLAEAISWRLAADLGYALTQSREVAETMMKGYEMELKSARYHDAQKKTPEGMYANTWLDTRN